MKKAILSLAAVITLFALMGCNNRDGEVVTPVQAQTLKPMQQSWRGVLPCADCEGIDTSLFLEKDGTWVMNQRYAGANGHRAFASYGKWARTADKLVLTDASGEKRYFHPKGEALEMLDREGNPIDSRLNYTLQPVKAELPATPMAMRGMYIYMANTGLFTDCATGQRIVMKPDTLLEKQFNQMRRESGQAVLLELNGHFVVQVRSNSGNAERVLVVDNEARFTPGKDCTD